MPGKHDHREALRLRGWAGSAGGDAGATKGERDVGGGDRGERRSWGRGEKGDEEEEGASTRCGSGGAGPCLHCST